MNDLVIHLCLLVLISLVIVTMGVFFNHREDGDALKALPRRLGVFLLGLAVVAAIMLVIEYTGASLD